MLSEAEISDHGGVSGGRAEISDQKNNLQKNIWSAEISTGLSVSLKILSCRIFFKKIFSHFLLLFFSIFFQKLSKSKGQ